MPTELARPVKDLAIRFSARHALIIFVLVALSLSCSKKDVEVEKWPFESRGIKITYTCDKNLNVYNGQPHTLLLCVYQISDPNAFNELRMDRTGVIKLLECKRFDPSVSSSDRIILHPGDEETVIYDRAEDAKFIGVVAGYYLLWPRHVSRLLLVPVEIEESGTIMKKRTATPGQLMVNLYFGPEEIQQRLE